MASRSLPDIWEGLPTTTEHLRGPPDHYQISRRASRPLPNMQEGFLTTPKHPGRSPDHSRTCGRDSLPLPDIREGLLTTPRHPGGPPDYSQTFERASRTSRMAFPMLPDIREGLPDIRQASLPLSDIWEGLLTTPGHPGGSPDHTWTSGRSPTTTGHSRGPRGLPGGFLNHSGTSGWPPGHSRTSGGSSHHTQTLGRVSRPLPDIREGLRTTPGHP